MHQCSEFQVECIQSTFTTLWWVSTELSDDVYGYVKLEIFWGPYSQEKGSYNHYLLPVHLFDTLLFMLLQTQKLMQTWMDHKPETMYNN